jgi:CBS-domain-containing membrane protein
MRAADVMTADVVAVGPETSVEEIVRLLLQHRISAVPVIDHAGRLLGMVSEGDLLPRGEPAPAGRRPWWLAMLSDSAVLVRDAVKPHGHRAADVMTRGVVTVEEDTPIEEIARLLERREIKRVPVMREGRVVGIVSRADLVRALASRPPTTGSGARPDSRAIRERVLGAMRAQPWWAGPGHTSVLVEDGVVHLWGAAPSPDARTSMRVIAGGIPGVRAVEDHLADWRGWAGLE